MWILQARKRHLRKFPRCRVGGHSADKCLERLEMIGHRRRPEPVIQGVLTEGALRPIDGGKDIVEIEISPRPLIERTAAREHGDSGSM